MICDIHIHHMPDTQVSAFDKNHDLREVKGV
jgi:hypothetical protein